jgi:hypothetical protein
MSENSPSGIEYSPGVRGKGRFGVRERLVAEHIAPLLAGKRHGTVKLYLVLRGVALLERDAGAREPGTVLPHISFEQLHDMCRAPSSFRLTTPEDEDEDASVRKKKREWVRYQVRLLVERSLVERTERPGRRPQLRVLKGDGSDEPLDDPDGSPGNSYVPIIGSVITSDDFRSWGVPELAGFLCAMTADRYARHEAGKYGHEFDEGEAVWFRQAAWFNNENGYRPEGHIPYPFSTATIERGLRSLVSMGWINVARLNQHPYKRVRLQGPRNIYSNQFTRCEARAEVVDLTQRRATQAS